LYAFFLCEFLQLFAPELASKYCEFLYTTPHNYRLKSIIFFSIRNDAIVDDSSSHIQDFLFIFFEEQKKKFEKKNQLRDFDLIYFRTRVSSTSHVSFHEIDFFSSV
jgi:hypothetical protein